MEEDLSDDLEMSLPKERSVDNLKDLSTPLNVLQDTIYA